MPDVRLSVDGRPISVPAGTLVAAAVMIAGSDGNRLSIGGEARGPLCGMGICFECRVTIDDQPHRLGCQTPCTDGMRVVTR